MPEAYITYSERETEELAFKLAENGKIKCGDIIALHGELGAGKTAFTRGLAGYFAPECRVTSPTFALVNQYGNIFHFDMYRINSEDDLLSVGFYDYLDGAGEKLIIIEWFDKIEGFFDEETVKIEIIKLNENERRIYAYTRN